MGIKNFTIDEETETVIYSDPELTDEQKDYLYDYMLDFMFKQKQREQMENEGRIPPFNYFDMEV